MLENLCFFAMAIFFVMKAISVVMEKCTYRREVLRLTALLDEQERERVEVQNEVTRLKNLIDQREVERVQKNIKFNAEIWAFMVANRKLMKRNRKLQIMLYMRKRRF